MDTLFIAQAKLAECQVLELALDIFEYQGSQAKDGTSYSYDLAFAAIIESYIHAKELLNEPAKTLYCTVASKRLQKALSELQKLCDTLSVDASKHAQQARIESLERESQLIPVLAERNNILINRERENAR